MSRHATLERLSSYLDGELPEPQSRQVAEHVADCRACRERLAGLRRVVERLAALESAGPPAHLGGLLGRQVRQEPRPRGPFERLERRIAEVNLQPSLAPTFALVILLAVVVYMFAVAVDRHRSRGVPVILNPPPLAGETLLEESGAAPRVPGESVGGETMSGEVPGEKRAAGRAPAEPTPGEPPAIAPGALGKEMTTATAGGRRFALLDGVWVEEGLVGAVPIERLRLDGPGWRQRHPELTPFATLGGRVLLRMDGRPVEVAFPADGPG